MNTVQCWHVKTWGEFDDGRGERAWRDTSYGIPGSFPAIGLKTIVLIYILSSFSWTLTTEESLAEYDHNVLNVLSCLLLYP
jgi:hypothetical protein